MLAAMSGAWRPPLPRLTWRTAGRAIAAGAAWGIAVAAGFTAYAWASCGVICLDDVLVMAATAIAAGIVSIGPLATFK
jgi:hypothetical protein